MSKNAVEHKDTFEVSILYTRIFELQLLTFLKIRSHRLLLVIELNQILSAFLSFLIH